MTRQKSNHYKGQNPIDYIVYHNPKGVSKVLYDYGYAPPKAPKDLAEATKELVKHRGEKAIKSLLERHPDKTSLLKLYASKAKTYCHQCNAPNDLNKTNYCSTCGTNNDQNSENENAFINQFKTSDLPNLERYYNTILKRSNQNPEDHLLAKEVQQTWNTLRKNKANQPPEDSKSLQITTREVLVMGVIFITGALVGHSIKLNSKHVK